MRRRGTAAVLAMIFLVVFSALTAAFYTMTTTSMQVAKNDRHSQQALAAAESGVALIQRAVADTILVEANRGDTEVTRKIFEGLQGTLGGQVATADIDPGGISFTLPRIDLNTNRTHFFVARVKVVPEDVNLDRPRLELTVTGTAGFDTRSQLQRSVTVILVPRDRAAEVFKYGLASKGRVELAKDKSNIIGDPPSAGNIISAYPGDYAIYSNGATISGDVFVAGDPRTAFSYEPGTGAIGNVDVADNEAKALTHVRQQEPPEFPEFTPNIYDLSVLTPLATNKGSKLDPAGTIYSDVCITGDYDFGANDTLQGLIYVREGVSVTFHGSTTIQGVIVVQDPVGDVTSTSRLYFNGVPVFQSPEWSDTSAVPAEVRADLSGYSILGPTAYIYMTGSEGGNPSPEHAGFARTVVCGTLEENGSGLVNIYDGTLITMADTYLTGARAYSSDFRGDGIRITKSSHYQFPMGGYTKRYSWVMDTTTYDELQ